MGLFNRKENRVYSLEQALKLLKTPQYAKYTTIPVGNGFKLVLEKEIITDSDELESKGFKQRRIKFLDQISGQGTDNNPVPDYNNYQSARRYQNQNNINLGR